MVDSTTLVQDHHFIFVSSPQSFCDLLLCCVLTLGDEDIYIPESN
jgi:hypothetical protein